MWLINDFRDFEECRKLFHDSTTVSSYNLYLLKKKSTDLSIYYSLWDGDKLIAYYWLMAFHGIKDKFRGHEYHVQDCYQNQGIGTFLYRYILVHEKLTIISDRSHTKFSCKIWDKLSNMSDIKVGLYNAITRDENFTEPMDREKVYNNDHMHYIARLNDKY